MRRHELYHLSRNEIVHFAEQYIHNKRYREIFIERCCDGTTYDELAAQYHMEYRHLQTIFKECMIDVLNGIERERGQK